MPKKKVLKADMERFKRLPDPEDPEFKVKAREILKGVNTEKDEALAVELLARLGKHEQIMAGEIAKEEEPALPAPTGLMSVEEAADYLRISSKTIRNWVSSKKIPHLKIGSRILFDAADLKEWLESKKVKVK